ncbi:unnamed protein product [Ectocarpus sp. CCAP 1310/34]|nr:unnamed protein product [Ectocarpus sp. CCAP 1310/34]
MAVQAEGAFVDVHFVPQTTGGGGTAQGP